jgi:hypothetical protein
MLQPPQQPQPPHCPRCEEELYEEDNTLPRRLVAGFLLLVAGALAVFGRREVALRKTGITASLLLAMWLMPRRIQWRCPTCGATYKRHRPPRGGTAELDQADQDGHSVS